MSRKNRRKHQSPQASQLSAPVGKRWIAQDSFANFEARVGYGTDNQSSAAGYQFDFISRNRVQLEAMYRSSWIVGQAVDVVAEDMTREGVEIRGELDPDSLGKLERAQKRLGIWQAISDTAKWSRLYGGAVGVLLIDGQNMATPLNPDSIGEGQFKGILPLDRWLVMPSMSDLVTEYGPHLGKPKFYEIVADGMALRRQKIHYSRVIRMDGVDLPYWQRLSENLWGQSVIERLFDRLIAFDSTTAGVAQLVYKAHLRTYQVEGLRDIIATGGPSMEGLIKQIEMIRRFQSNEGITLMDAKDKMETFQYTFAGLDDVLLQFGQQLSGALQIPLVRLFGQSPAGLNSSGESDLKTYYDRIKQEQERRLAGPLATVFDVLHRSELGEAPDEDFHVEFTPLFQLDHVQRADVADKTATAVATVFGEGLISERTALQELKQSSQVTGIFTNITDEQIENADPELPQVEDPPEAGGDPSTQVLPQNQGPESGAFSLDADWSEADHPRRENGEFGNGGSGQSTQKLSANEKSALSSYSGDDFYRINAALRNGDDSDPMIKRIDSAIEKSDLQAGTVLYRGMTREAAKKLFSGGNIEAGKTISDLAYSSTSSDRSEAAMRGMGGVMLKIEAGSGAKGLDMSEHSRNKNEKEVLLPRGAKMKILGVIPPKSKTDPVTVRVSYGE